MAKEQKSKIPSSILDARVRQKFFKQNGMRFLKLLRGAPNSLSLTWTCVWAIP